MDAVAGELSLGNRYCDPYRLVFTSCLYQLEYIHAVQPIFDVFYHDDRNRPPAQQIGAGNGGIAGSLDIRLRFHALGFSRRA